MSYAFWTSYLYGDAISKFGEVHKANNIVRIIQIQRLWELDRNDKAEKERRKLMETLSRSGLPPELAAMQAYDGKLAGSSSLAALTGSKGYKDPLQLIPPEFSQALFAEMATQMAAVQSGSSSSQ